MPELTTSIYVYPWDLLDEGIERALETIAALGVDAIHVAMSGLGACLNVGSPQIRDFAHLAAEACEAADRGFVNIGFYNYGMLPHHRLLWVGDAIRLIRAGGN